MTSRPLAMANDIGEDVSNSSSWEIQNLVKIFPLKNSGKSGHFTYIHEEVDYYVSQSPVSLCSVSKLSSTA